jgi:hypothetical protein
VPFLLDTVAQRLNQGFVRLYQWHLLGTLKRSDRAKFGSRPDGPAPLARLARLRDFYAFDDQVTAPLHGYAGVHDYYARASGRPYRRRIPTLILHALDDPFMLPEAAPDPRELSANVYLECSPCGGPVGFVAGRWPWRAESWLERRIPEFLSARGFCRSNRSPCPVTDGV